MVERTGRAQNIKVIASMSLVMFALAGMTGALTGTSHAQSTDNCDMTLSLMPNDPFVFSDARYGLESSAETLTITNTGNLQLDSIQITTNVQWTPQGSDDPITGITTEIQRPGSEAFSDFRSETITLNLAAGNTTDLNLRVDMTQYDGNNAPTGTLEQPVTYTGACTPSAPTS